MRSALGTAECARVASIARRSLARVYAWALRCLGAASVFVATGCTSLAYVTQAAVGQNDLSVRARDIDTLVRDQRVDARMRRLLSDVADMKRFGESYGLTATTNYTKYVKVNGPAVVWVVSASDPLRFHSKSWSFPLVGSFTYLGWFHKPDAEAFAAELGKERLDVDVRGSAAYSTQGYFEDPVVSSMIYPGKEALGELANVILHESAHATFFVRNQSTLNESVANFVGNTLGERYLEERLGRDAPETVAYVKTRASYDTRRQALRDAFVLLDALYASDKPDAQKLAEKAQILTGLRERLHYPRAINNATLIQYRTYNSGQGELAELLSACGGEFPRFMKSLARLERTRFAKAQESDVGKMVKPLVEARCPI
jgi:predicted aminopeptidase